MPPHVTICRSEQLVLLLVTCAVPCVVLRRPVAYVPVAQHPVAGLAFLRAV